MSELTAGIDIGTTSVKAVVASGDGTVVERVRIPHPLLVPEPDRFEHDAGRAWRRGPRRALAALRRLAPEAVSVAAMVPSLAAVDRRGIPRTPGLLYGDARGRTGSTASPAESGELVAFLRWCARERPDAAGYWPAQAVANHALGDHAVLDTSTAATAFPLFDWTGWDAAVAEAAGARVDQLPRIEPTAVATGRVRDDGPLLASGCIDALAEQIVAGADEVGDVLVILGTTLIVWTVVPEPARSAAAGYFVIPHTAPGTLLVGGPSNAGGLFLDWALRLHPRARDTVDPGRVPVWAPYPRGERTPLHDPDRRAAVHDLDLTHGVAALRRAAFEASGFAARRAIDAAEAATGVSPRRVVATGGGTRVGEWVGALADATSLPVDCVAVPEGGALGSAWLARMAAGRETAMADARRWARVGRRVEPDPRYVRPTAERYRRFLELSTDA